jgi:hypothetical protein
LPVGFVVRGKVFSQEVIFQACLENVRRDDEGKGHSIPPGREGQRRAEVQHQHNRVNRVPDDAVGAAIYDPVIGLEGGLSSPETPQIAPTIEGAKHSQQGQERTRQCDRPTLRPGGNNYPAERGGEASQH